MIYDLAASLGWKRLVGFLFVDMGTKAVDLGFLLIFMFFFLVHKNQLYAFYAYIMAF